MNWDDLRYLVTLQRAGSLSKASQALEVDHTTVGRRVESAEAALGVKLFTRTPTGYVPTADAERLLAGLQAVEAAVHAVERQAAAHQQSLEGTVRVTSPETFGIAYLAPRLAAWGRANPGVAIELMPSGDVKDLGRRQAEIAVRFFRSPQENLAVRRVAEIHYGLYASPDYLARRPPKSRAELSAHPWLLPRQGPEREWVEKLCGPVKPAFESDVSLALASAARGGAGLTVLPCYLAEQEPSLERVPLLDFPTEHVWLTVHKDLRATPRVRALLDHLASMLAADHALLAGR